MAEAVRRSTRVLQCDNELTRQAHRGAFLKARIAQDKRELEGLQLVFELEFHRTKSSVAVDSDGAPVAELVNTSSRRFDPKWFRRVHPRLARQFTRLYPSVNVAFGIPTTESGGQQSV